MDCLSRIVAEDNCTVTIRLEVDANVEFDCFVVQMLYSSRNAENGHFLKENTYTMSTRRRS